MSGKFVLASGKSQGMSGNFVLSSLYEPCMGRTRTDGPDKFDPSKFDCTMDQLQ